MLFRSAANPQTFNRYIYTGNNPVNITDPSGLVWCSKATGNVEDFEWQEKECRDGWNTEPDGRSTTVTSETFTSSDGSQVARKGDVITLNGNGSITINLTAPRHQAQEQGQLVQQGSTVVSGTTAADAAASGSGVGESGITQLPTAASTGPPLLSLCPTGTSCKPPSGTFSTERLDISKNEPLKSVEGIARLFELCSLGPGIGSACAVGAAATRFGQGRFGEAGDNLLNVVPFLGIARKADKAADVAQRGTTVIGHLYNVSPNYVEVAKSLGANYLKPSPNWNWRMQGDFIKDVIRRGDNVFIGTPIRGGKSVLKREIKQLIKAGYRPARQGSKWLIKAD